MSEGTKKSDAPMALIEGLPIAEIRENPVALRSVSRKSEKYLQIVDSIKTRGFIGAVSVRVKTDEETKVKFYELIDGLHRYTAAKDAGLDKINVNVLTLDDAEALELQVIMNSVKVDTKPTEYSKHLQQLLGMNPLMTVAELAGKLVKSPQWISDRLQLTKIDNPDIQKLIDSGKIKLGNAVALAKLPIEEHANFLQRAITDAPNLFIPAVKVRLKEVRDAKRAGKAAEPAKFMPQPHLRQLKEIRNELGLGDKDKSGKVANVLIKSTGAKTPTDGFRLGVAWVINFDPESKKAQIAKHDADTKAKEMVTAEKAAKKARAKEDKAKKDQVEAAKTAVAAEEKAKELAGEKKA